MTLTPPEVSVVVCSRNGAATIGACLTALAAQTGVHYEVIVVDDGSTDGTADVAREHCDRVVRHARNLGLGAARNTGFRAAGSSIVAFTDDDCVPAPGWLDGLLAHFRAECAATVHAVGGSVRPLTTDTAARRYVAAHNPLQPLERTAHQDGSPLCRAQAYLATEIGLMRRPDGPRPVRSLVGASMAFRSSTLDALGGFDERIRFGGEEEDLCRRLGEAHGPAAVWFDPDVEIRHDFDRTTRDVLRRRFAYGRGNARTFLKARRIVPPVPPAAATAVLLAAAALRGRRQAIRWLALPALFYLLATVGGVRRPAQLVGHPLLRFLEETCTFAGFVTGWMAFRSHYRGGQDG